MKGFIISTKEFKDTVAIAKTLGENGVFTRKEFNDFYNSTRYKGWGHSSFYNFASIRPILKVVKTETFTIKNENGVGYTNGIDTISEKAYNSLPTSIKPLFKETKGVIEGKRYYYTIDEKAYKDLILRHNCVCLQRITTMSEKIEDLKTKIEFYHNLMV